MHGKIKSGLALGAAAILFGLLQSAFDNVLLLLAAGWFTTLASVQLVSGTIRRAIRTDSIENRLYLSSGLASPVELVIITVTMSAFSFIMLFAWHSHWFLIVHGVWWGLVSLRQLTK